MTRASRLLLLSFLLAAGAGAAEPAATNAPRAIPADFAKEAFIASSATNVLLRIARADCIAWALRKNADVRIRKMDPLIRDKDVEAARAAFSPTLGAAATVSDSRTAIPYPDGSSTNSEAEVLDLRAGLSGRLAAGTRYSVELINSRVDETVSKIPVSPYYQVKPVVTLTQPLFRGAGTTVNEAEIELALNRQRQSRHDVVDALMDALSRTLAAYDAFCYSVAAQALAQASLSRANALLAINRERFGKGLLSSVDLLESEAAAAQRLKALIATETGVRRAEDSLKVLTGLVDDPLLWNARIEALDSPAVEKRRTDLAASLASAFERRPDYLAKRIDLENRDIQVLLAKDASHPTVDLIGSFGLNGIGEDYADAWSRAQGDSTEWSAGIRFSLPLGGGEKARLDQKHLEKAQGLLELKRLELAIILDVRDAVGEMDVSYRQLEAARLALEKERENYRAQEERLKAGQISTHDMIDYQNRLFSAELDYQKAIVDCQTALVRADRAEGATLIRNRIRLEDSP